MRERSPSQLTAKPALLVHPTEDLQGRELGISVLPPPALRKLPVLVGGEGEGTRALSTANPLVPQRQGQLEPQYEQPKIHTTDKGHVVSQTLSRCL